MKENTKNVKNRSINSFFERILMICKSHQLLELESFFEGLELKMWRAQHRNHPNFHGLQQKTESPCVVLCARFGPRDRPGPPCNPRRRQLSPARRKFYITNHLACIASHLVSWVLRQAAVIHHLIASSAVWRIELSSLIFSKNVKNTPQTVWQKTWQFLATWEKPASSV